MSCPSATVTVAVATFRRPDDLGEVLPLLVAQVAAVARDAGATAAVTVPAAAVTVPGAAVAPPAVRRATVEVLVVDNDPDASAAGIVDALAPPGTAVRYVHEPHPGIAAARNRALRECADRDVLVFIDDDERPRDGWLAALLRTWERTRACGVVGPVTSVFPGQLDPWLRAGGFFERRRLPTGAPVEVAATNNVLLDLGAVRRAGLWFEEALGLVGGSDTLFTRRLVAAAGPLVWCDEAAVTDVVAPGRATRGWALRRQLRSGGSWSRTLLLATDGRGRRLALRLRLAAQGGGRVGAGALRLVLGAVTGDLRHRAGGARAVARGSGMWFGAFGYTYAEYRRAVPAGRESPAVPVGRESPAVPAGRESPAVPVGRA